jgi:hypothetical protein
MIERNLNNYSMPTALHDTEAATKITRNIVTIYYELRGVGVRLAVVSRSENHKMFLGVYPIYYSIEIHAISPMQIT